MADTAEISHPLFASFYDHAPTDGLLRPHREYLTADLSGRVLDLGAGTGDLFPYAAARGDAVELHAVEPDPHMRRRAARRARADGIDVDLRGARAESLPYPDDHFDAVLSSVVFCTIADPDAALEEVTRVLRSDGEFRFVEHVRSDGWRARAQGVIEPVWSRVSAGCRLTRRSIERFVSHPAFDVLEVERLEDGTFPAEPLVRGRLKRRQRQSE